MQVRGKSIEHRTGRTPRTAWAWAAVLALAPAIHGAEPGLTGLLRLELPEALLFQAGRGKDSRLVKEPLQLDLSVRNGQWSRVAWGFNPEMPGQEHVGELTESKIEGDKVELKVTLRVAPSRQSPVRLGGTAQYVITVTRQGEKFAGTFTGTCTDMNRPEVHVALEKAWGWGYALGGQEWGHPLLRNRMEAFLASGAVSGNVSGTLEPDPLAGLDFARFKGGEHPRLLFTAADLPALREKAKTPAGAKVMAELKAMLDLAEQRGFAYREAAEHSMGNIWGAGCGLMYQLTGERRWADLAALYCRHNLHGNYYYGGGWLHPYTLMGLALSYDLCYDAWDPEFRGMVYSFVEQQIRQLACRHDPADLLNTSERYVFANDHGNFAVRDLRDGKAAKFRAAAALATLALLNDPPPAYQPPALDQVPVLEPASDYQPWIGVPVVPFESDIMPRDWLVNGPFQRGATEAAMAPLGGLAKARPEVGTTALSDGVPVDFRRYRPNGWDNVHGGTIYSRVCNVNWGHGTGGGYAPGIALLRKWNTQAQRNVATNVVLYTVIDNDRERVVQALPNWRSESIGNRMWLNGREVRDGDLVRLKPGLYPLMVDVELVGGYSAQAPKLREYTPADQQRDAALAERARTAFTGRDALDNEMIRNATLLLRSVRRYVPADIDAAGWGVQDSQEALLPLMTVLQRMHGVNLSAGTGVDAIVPLAVRMRGHSDARTYDFLVGQSFAVMPEKYRGLAQWYLDTYGLSLRRPIDALIALVTLPPGLTPQPPEALCTKAGVFPGYNIHTFRSGWSGDQDVLTFIEAANPAFTPPLVGGNFFLHGLGRAWVFPRYGAKYEDANVLSIRGAVPDRYAKTLSAAQQPDGGGTVAIEQAGYRELVPGAKDQPPTPGRDLGIVVQRHFGVDYSGRSGSPAVVVIADRIANAAHREKVWRYDLGDVNEFDKVAPDKAMLQEGGNGFLVRPRPNPQRETVPAGACLKATIFAPGELTFQRLVYGEGRRVVLEVQLDRAASKLERAVKKGPDALKGAAGSKDDDVLEDIVAKTKESERTTRPPIMVYTVLTLQAGQPPKVSISGEGEAAVLQIGEQTARLQDGQIRFGP